MGPCVKGKLHCVKDPRFNGMTLRLKPYRARHYVQRVNLILKVGPGRWHRTCVNGPGIANHVIDTLQFKKRWFRMRVDHRAILGSGTYCPPRHRMPFASRMEPSRCVATMGRAFGLVIGCQLTQVPRIEKACR